MTTDLFDMYTFSSIKTPNDGRIRPSATSFFWNINFLNLECPTCRFSCHMRNIMTFMRNDHKIHPSAVKYRERIHRGRFQGLREPTKVLVVFWRIEGYFLRMVLKQTTWFVFICHAKRVLGTFMFKNVAFQFRVCAKGTPPLHAALVLIDYNM